MSKIQTAREFFTELFTKHPTWQLLKLIQLQSGQLTITEEQVSDAIAQARGDGRQPEEVVRHYMVHRMLSDFPLREAPIRYAWPYDAVGKSRLDYIPKETDKSIKVKPRIDYDRWVVDCPFCPGAEIAMDLFFCGSCLGTGLFPGGPESYTGLIRPVGIKWIQVDWPPELEQNEREEAYEGGVE